MCDPNSTAQLQPGDHDALQTEYGKAQGKGMGMKQALSSAIDAVAIGHTAAMNTMNTVNSASASSGAQAAKAAGVRSTGPTNAPSSAG